MTAAATPSQAPPSYSGLPMPARAWAVLTWSLGLGLTALDSNLANVALPAIAHDLGVSPSAAIWVTNSAQIAAAVCVLPMSAFADSVGFRRIFKFGVAAFVIGSLICALSPNLPILILGRILTGMANGCVFGVIGAFVRAAYPPAVLGRGLAFNSALVSLMAATGPSVAAGVLSVATWPWLFALGVPLGLLAFGLSYRFLPDSPRKPHRWDLPSAVLNAAMFTLFIIGVHGFSHGGSPLTWLALAASAAAAFVFVRRQLVSPAPILGVDLLKIPLVSMSVITMLFCFCAQSMALVTIPFFLFSAGSAGHALLLSAWPLGGLLIAPIAGRLADKHPVGLLGGAGMAVVAIGIVCVAIAPTHAAVWDLAWRIALCGVGFGLFGPPNHRGIIASSPPHRAGAAGGLNAAFRVLGQSTGSALVAVIFGLAAQGRATGFSIDVALYAAAGLAAVGAAFSFSRTKL